MLECVAGESSVVYLDVELEVLVKTVSLEEAYYGFAVNIILVLGGFHGFGLDEECACEAFGACVVACYGKHHGQVLFLTLLVGIEQ